MQCFCVKCDQPVSECINWGDGSSMIHHCNIDSVSMRNMQRRRPESLGAVQAAGVEPGYGWSARDEATAVDAVQLNTRRPHGLANSRLLLESSQLPEIQGGAMRPAQELNGGEGAVAAGGVAPGGAAEALRRPLTPAVVSQEDLATNYVKWGTLDVPVYVCTALFEPVPLLCPLLSRYVCTNNKMLALL